MWKSRHVLATVALCAIIGAVPASAQMVTAPRPSRPYRGLFGGGVGNVEQVLTLNASIGGGVDDTLGSANPSGVQAPALARVVSGGHGFGSAALGYSFDRPRIGFGISGSTAARYSPHARQDIVNSRSASANLALRPFTSTQLFAGATVSHQPYHLLDLFPALFETYAGRPSTFYEDFAISGNYYTRYTTQAGAAQDIALGRRSSLSLDYRWTRIEASTLARDFITQRAGARFTRNLTRALGFHAGYHYTHYDYPGSASRGSRLRGHSLDLGIDFVKPLSLTRSTTLSLSSGSTAFVRDRQQIYRVTGNAVLSHEIGRSWNTSITYNRNVRLLDTFYDPVFYDAASVTLTGLITSHLDVALVARASDGKIGLTTGNRYRTYMGTLTLTAALTRHLAVSGSYFYNEYSFDSSTTLPFGVLDARRRHGVRAVLSLWAPLFSRARKP
jgi:hypothetical protein